VEKTSAALARRVHHRWGKLPGFRIKDSKSIELWPHVTGQRFDNAARGAVLGAGKKP
jgi:hypothetical protein